VILVREHTQFWGHLLTGAVVAGGSKASIKLFQDVLGIRSTAEKERQAIAEEKRKRVAAQAAAGVVAAAPAGGK
jgi:hypothetical protein